MRFLVSASRSRRVTFTDSKISTFSRKRFKFMVPTLCWRPSCGIIGGGMSSVPSRSSGSFTSASTASHSSSKPLMSLTSTASDCGHSCSPVTHDSTSCSRSKTSAPSNQQSIRSRSFISVSPAYTTTRFAGKAPNFCAYKDSTLVISLMKSRGTIGLSSELLRPPRNAIGKDPRFPSAHMWSGWLLKVSKHLRHLAEPWYFVHVGPQPEDSPPPTMTARRRPET
mmetsp:Transcript_38344/g.75501  ORF Transcript_38344/g.75501 Transcript_38344/m.75501 type:complete len:224 (-) Transcript_38344:5562-6233(-)